MRQIVIYPGEDGYWVAECPSLPGCISQGKTREEAIVNAREAIQAYIAALEDDDVAKSWVAEASRRHNDLKLGKARSSPSEEVLERLESRHRR